MTAEKNPRTLLIAGVLTITRSTAESIQSEHQIRLSSYDEALSTYMFVQGCSQFAGFPHLAGQCGLSRLELTQVVSQS